LCFTIQMLKNNIVLITDKTIKLITIDWLMECILFSRLSSDYNKLVTNMFIIVFLTTICCYHCWHGSYFKFFFHAIPPKHTTITWSHWSRFLRGKRRASTLHVYISPPSDQLSSFWLSYSHRLKHDDSYTMSPLQLAILETFFVEVRTILKRLCYFSMCTIKLMIWPWTSGNF